MTNKEVESWVLATCRELGLAVDSSDDNFFTAGGSSLMAVKLIAKAEEVFGEDTLPPEDLFDRAGIREIALTIAANREQA